MCSLRVSTMVCDIFVFYPYSCVTILRKRKRRNGRRTKRRKERRKRGGRRKSREKGVQALMRSTGSIGTNYIFNLLVNCFIYWHESLFDLCLGDSILNLNKFFNNMCVCLANQVKRGTIRSCDNL